MATRRTNAVQKALCDKGMERDESHHHMFRKSFEGVPHLVTRTSHSGREIDDRLAQKMAKQLCLQLGEFWALVDCDLSEQGWDALVRERWSEGRNPFFGT